MYTAKNKALGFLGKIKCAIDNISKALSGHRAGATNEEILEEAQLLIGFAKHLEHEIWRLGKSSRRKV